MQVTPQTASTTPPSGREPLATATPNPASSPTAAIGAVRTRSNTRPIIVGSMSDDVGEVLSGLWRFEAVHPEWTEDEGGEDGWDPTVSWLATASGDGLVLIDPLVAEWPALDELVEAHGGCAGIIRTCHWHQRSIAEASQRYGADVWARPAASSEIDKPFDHALADGEEPFGLRVIDIERIDEIGLWLPAQQALVFGDAMIRRGNGELRMCPPSWTQPPGGRERLRDVLTGLTAWPVAHVLVSHGPLVLGDGLASLRSALSSG